MTASAAVGLWAAATGAASLFFCRVLPWIIVGSHGLSIYHETKEPDSGRSVVDGAAAGMFLLLLEGIYSGREFRESGDALVCALSISLSVIPLIIFVSIPRGDDQFHQSSPIDRQNTASLIQLLAFTWPSKAFKLENLRQKNIADLPVLPASLRTATLAEHHRRFASQLASRSLGFVLIRHYLGPLILQSVLAILHSLAVLGPNMATYRLLQHLSGEREGDARDKLFLTLLLGASNLLPVFLNAWVKWIGSSMIDVPMRSTLAALTYQKVLSLPTVANKAESKGAQNRRTPLYMSALSARACSAFPLYYKVVGLLTQLVCTTVILVGLVGWKSVAVAIAAALLITPITTMFMKRMTVLVRRTWKLQSGRNAVLQHALLAIRQIKLSAAESAWERKIYEIRDKEVRGYYEVAWVRFWMVIVASISPAILSGVPLYIYAWQGHALTASVAFTFINLFKELQSKLWAIPEQIPRIRAGWACANELDAFLRREEMDESRFGTSDVLSLRNATITWHTEDSKETFRLKNIDTDFPTGELSIITGKTGCGKSLLLSALAGEAQLVSGDIHRPSSTSSPSAEGKPSSNDDWIEPSGIALVSQNPWLDNATIRDNILFGLPMDRERYARVLWCRALDKDLRKLKDGDETVVAIKGASLSGGQKSRIALARGLYSRAGCLLMDDVLSAVDAEVRGWIVDKALCGSLARGRTRVLATHHEMQVLPRAAYKLIISDHSAKGELVSQCNSPSTEQHKSATCLTTDDGLTYIPPEEQSGHSSSAKETSTPSHLTKSDVTEEETFRLAPYAMYLNASGGCACWLPVLAALALHEWNKISTSSRLEAWVSGSGGISSTGGRGALSPGQAYLLLSALTTLTASMQGALMHRRCRTASKKLFGQMIDSIFGAPLRWLESASQGEILQRCDREMRARWTRT